MNLQNFYHQVSSYSQSVHYVKFFTLFTAEDVLVSDTTINSAMVSWRIPTFETQEQYYILYGTDPDNLNQTTDSITSPLDTSVVNMTYDITLTELLSGTVYYVRVAAVFDEVFERYSETIPFITKEPRKFNSITNKLPFGLKSSFITCFCRTNIFSPISASHKFYNTRAL